VSSSASTPFDDFVGDIIVCTVNNMLPNQVACILHPLMLRGNYQWGYLPEIGGKTMESGQPSLHPGIQGRYRTFGGLD
jgi:hypothetical protein